MRSGYWVAGLIVLLVTVPLVALGLHADESGDFAFWRDPYTLRVARFSLWQAGLSTIFSVLPAILLARALVCYGRFPARRLLLGLLGLPLVVPSIVAVLGIISVFGVSGWTPLGRGLYGITGILIAHVFFNLPLAARLLLPALEHIPPSQWRLARQLGMGTWQRFKLIEWPALKSTLPSVSLLVFMLCLTSFAVVLGLGGGPRSTTLEVAIYQSLRFDFDPGRAVILALLQLCLCLVLATLSARLTGIRNSEGDIGNARPETTDQGFAAHLLNGFIIAFTIIFVGGILAEIVVDGISGPIAEVIGDARLWRSTAYSILIAVTAALLAGTAGWLILKTGALEAYRGKHNRAHALDTAASVIYLVPPLVIGTGAFLLLHGSIGISSATFPIVILVNTLMGIPFVIRSLGSVMRQRTLEYEHLCQSLDIDGWKRFKMVDFPLLRRPLGLAVALVMALSFGDLGVIALFAGNDRVTLPLLLYHRLSAYQIPQAAVTALILLIACLLLFTLIERLVGGRKNVAR